VYVQPLGSVIRPFDMLYHMFADDTQLQKSAPPSQLSKVLVSTQQTVESVKNWMNTNKLKMNDEKTEVIPIGTECKLKSVPDSTSLTLSGAEIKLSKSVRNLGVHLDRSLSMEQHISTLRRAIFLELRRISHIRPFLTVDATKRLMSAFVLSRMDYCNSLFVGLPNTLLDKLQRAQNNAARIVLRKRKVDHAKPLLRELHWLPVRARIEFKVASLCYRSLHGLAPTYLSELLVPYQPSRSLRSADAGHLSVPRIKLETFGRRSFSFAGPKIWNALPLSLRNASTLSAFKSGLKTHLFRVHLLE
jgi:hypothetical protein